MPIAIAADLDVPSRELCLDGLSGASVPLRAELLRDAVVLSDGEVTLGERPGLGIDLTAAIEREFPFREDAVYRCLVDPELARDGWPSP